MKQHNKTSIKKPKKLNFKIDEITLVLIVVIISTIVSVYDKNNVSEVPLEKITGMILKDDSISSASNGIVDENKLNTIKNLDYFELKRSINAKEDFCLYLEDEEGNVILSKGSSKLTTDGIVCEE